MMQIIDDVSLFPQLSAVLVADTGELHDDDPLLDPMNLGGYRVAPWGVNNDLPNIVMANIGKSEVMSSNVEFNRNVMYGLGPKLVRKMPDGTFQDVEEGKEYDFFERNDISMYLMEIMTDMAYFSNAFTQLIPDKGFREIYTIRNLEAVFSRWGLDAKCQIDSHLYCNQWVDGNPTKENIIRTPVIDEFDAEMSTRALLSIRSKRLVYATYMPSPGRPYYSRPSWYSLFASGWYAQAMAIPALKKAIMKNQLGIKFIIYFSPKYFRQRFEEEGIDPKNIKACQELREKEVQKIRDFLAGEENMSKAMVAMKEMIPTSSSGAEEKYIEVLPVKNDISGGEFLVDLDSVTNMTCYAMGIHPTLIGAVPGKSSGSLSGTDKRELFLIKQAMMKPMVDRCMKPLSLVKKINGWDKNIYITIPEYIFTTLDQNKSGKQESTSNEV